MNKHSKSKDKNFVQYGWMQKGLIVNKFFIIFILFFTLLLSNISIVSAYTEYNGFAAANGYANGVGSAGLGLASSNGLSSSDMGYLSEIKMGIYLEMTEGGSALMNQEHITDGSDSGSKTKFSSSFLGTNVKDAKMRMKMVTEKWDGDKEDSNDEASIDFSNKNKAVMHHKHPNDKSVGDKYSYALNLVNMYQCSNTVILGHDSESTDKTPDSGTLDEQNSETTDKTPDSETLDEQNSETTDQTPDSGTLDEQNSETTDKTPDSETLDEQNSETTDQTPDSETLDEQNSETTDQTPDSGTLDVQNAESTDQTPDPIENLIAAQRNAVEFVPFPSEMDLPAEVVSQNLDVYVDMDGDIVKSLGYNYASYVKASDIECSSAMVFNMNP